MDLILLRSPPLGLALGLGLGIRLGLVSCVLSGTEWWSELAKSSNCEFASWTNVWDGIAGNGPSSEILLCDDADIDDR